MYFRFLTFNGLTNFINYFEFPSKCGGYLKCLISSAFLLNRNTAVDRDNRSTPDGAQEQHVPSRVQRTIGDRLLLAPASERHRHHSDGTRRQASRKRRQPEQENPVSVHGRRAVFRPVSRGRRRGVHGRHGRLDLCPRPDRWPT